jgi:dTDP-4-amino-4,6-dideoxygalactose transaminase
MTYPIEKSTGFGFFRGRVALACALKALNVGPGDMVAVQAFTCSALAEAILSIDAVPLWIDITADGYTMDAGDLEKKLSQASNVKALIVQHTYGFAADMDALMGVAAKYHLPVIEDCCHTLFTRWGGKQVGRFGVAAFYSFEAGKPLVAGLGGWLRVNNPHLYEKVAELHKQYEQPGLFEQVRTLAMFIAYSILYRPSTFWAIKRVFRMLAKYGIVRGNYNTVEVDDAASTPTLDLSDFTKGLGHLQEKTVFLRQRAAERSISHRNRAAAAYARNFPLRHDARAENVVLKYPVLVPKKEATLKQAEENSIELSDNYSTPVHPYEGRELEMARYVMGSCPNAEKKANHVVALPCPVSFNDKAITKSIAFLRSQI